MSQSILVCCRTGLLYLPLFRLPKALWIKRLHYTLFSKRTWRTFSAEPAHFSTEDDEKEIDEISGDFEMPIGDFFYNLADEYSPIVSFTNLDGMETYFQKPTPWIKVAVNLSFPYTRLRLLQDACSPGLLEVVR